MQLPAPDQLREDSEKPPEPVWSESRLVKQ